MFIKIEGEKVKEVKFNIFEPPRFFEAFCVEEIIMRRQILQQGFVEFVPLHIK